MAVTPTGILSLPGDSLRTTLSTCAAFQSFVGAADATAALSKIYVIARPSVEASEDNGESEDEGWERPYALISLPRNLRFFRGGYTNGTLTLLIEADVDGATYAVTDPDATMDFSNKIGAIIKELVIALDGDGALIIPPGGAMMDTEITRSELKDEGDYHQAVATLDYGVGLES